MTNEQIEQREQSDACIDSAESRQKKAEGQQIEQREQSDACIDSAESRQKKAEGQQIEQKKQQLKQLAEEVKQLKDELVEAGAWPLNDSDLEQAAGGIYMRPGIERESQVLF